MEPLAQLMRENWAWLTGVGGGFAWLVGLGYKVKSHSRRLSEIENAAKADREASHQSRVRVYDKLDELKTTQAANHARLLEVLLNNKP